VLCRKHHDRLRDLTHVAQALDLPPALSRAVQGRQEYADQQGDDADDDQEFNQSEGSTMPAVRHDVPPTRAHAREAQ
jgi:hypothetical protein